MEQERSQHQWHLILCSYPKISSTLGFFSLFLTHTLKYYLHPFPPPMSTSLKYTRVWYPRSRVRCHCAWIVSNISAEAMASQTLPRHAETSETHLSLSAKPVKVPTVSYTPLSYCLMVVPTENVNSICINTSVSDYLICLPHHFLWLFVSLCCSLVFLYTMLWGREKGINSNRGLLHARHFTTHAISLSYFWHIQEALSCIF